MKTNQEIRDQLKIAAVKMLKTNDLKTINDYVNNLTDEEVVTFNNFFNHVNQGGNHGE